MQIRTIMNPIQAVTPDEYATRARALLREEEHVLAVTAENRLLGIITRQDVMLVTSTKSNLKARDIMSQPLFTVEVNEEVHAVGRKMVASDVYCTPVVESGAVVGVVRMEDIIQAVHRPSSRKVADFMTREVISCDKTEEITRVWDLMEFHNFSGLPVTEEVTTSHRKYKKLAGFVTRKDILGAGDVRPGKDGGRFTHPPPIEKVMTRTPKYVHLEDSVDECVTLLTKYKIGQLPVVKNGLELVGIVDREDILKIYV